MERNFLTLSGVSSPVLHPSIYCLKRIKSPEKMRLTVE